MWLCFPFVCPYFGSHCLDSSTFIHTSLVLMLLLLLLLHIFILRCVLNFYVLLVFLFFSFFCIYFLCLALWINCCGCGCCCCCFFFCIISRLFLYSMSTVLIEFWHFDRKSLELRIDLSGKYLIIIIQVPATILIFCDRNLISRTWHLINTVDIFKWPVQNSSYSVIAAIKMLKLSKIF